MSSHLKLIPTDRSSVELPDRSDDELMLLASAGRSDAFAVLAGRHLQGLASFCGKYLGSAQLGEEQAQETLVQVWVQRSRYRASGRFPSFLYTIAQNLCRNQSRHMKRRSAWLELAARPAVPSASPEVLEALLETERTRRVHHAMTLLTDKLKEAVLLRFDRGLDYATIADILGCPEETARSRVFHGLKKLRADLLPEELT